MKVKQHLVEESTQGLGGVGVGGGLSTTNDAKPDVVLVLDCGDVLDELTHSERLCLISLSRTIDAATLINERLSTGTGRSPAGTILTHHAPPTPTPGWPPPIPTSPSLPLSKSIICTINTTPTLRGSQMCVN